MMIFPFPKYYDPNFSKDYFYKKYLEASIKMWFKCTIYDSNSSLISSAQIIKRSSVNSSSLSLSNPSPRKSSPSKAKE